MTGAMKKINKRIPGFLPPLPRTEVDGKVTDLSSKTHPELLELRDRQLKLLSNKTFISKLPDRGIKIQAFYNKIVKEIQARKEEAQTCSMFDKLRLDNETVQDVEWKGKRDTKNYVYLDSDDDSDPEDVIHILSQSTAQEKIVKVLPPEKPLVTSEDLLKIGEIPHVKYLVDKTELSQKHITHQFKPYQTTKTNVHDPSKEIGRKKHKHWEITAATPPPSIHGPAKELCLEESLKLQRDHNIHLKEVETKHAAEKLMSRLGIKMANLPSETSTFGPYRDAADDGDSESDPEGSDKEVHDEEPEKGGVIFTVTE